MSKTKSNKKGGLLIWFIVIVAVVIIAGVVISIVQYKKNNELQLSNANNTISDIATETGLVDKSDGSFYITLYATAGVIIIAGIVVFVYVHKKADE